VAYSIWTYALLLFSCLGACPHAALAGQRATPAEPRPAPLLPVEEAWNVALPAPPAAEGAIDAARAFIPLESGLLVALDRETGQTVWSLELERGSPPVVRNGLLYVAGEGGLRAVDAATGEQRWVAPLDGPLGARMVIGGDVLVTAVETGRVTAHDSNDGRRLWSHDVERTDSLALALGQDSVIVTAGDRLLRLSVEDGALLWEQRLDGMLSSPLVDGDRVFVGSSAKQLFAVDMGDGRLAWRWRLGGAAVGAAVDAANDLIVVASRDQLLRGLRRGTGNQVWQRPLTTRLLAPPSAFGHLVLVSGNDPTLTTFNARTGAPLATFTAPADLRGVPLVDPDLQPFRVALVAVTRDGRAIGLRPVGMLFREAPLVPLSSLPGKPLPREPFAPPSAPLAH
jgi:outer membrane protein assembly factor BamB